MSEQDKSENNKENKTVSPQKNFLSDMYDDFFWLMNATPDNYDDDIARQKFLDDQHKKFEGFDIKARADYLKELAKNEEAELKAAKEEIDNKEKEAALTDEEKAKAIAEEKEKLQKRLEEFFEKVDDLNLTDESKVVLKKMIEYTKKFKEGLVKRYIPFNMRIYCDNSEVLDQITDLICEAFCYYGYMKNNSVGSRSFYQVEETSQITDLYTNAHSVVVFKDVEGLQNKDKSLRDKLLKIWENAIYSYSNLEGITTIIVDKDKSNIDNLFANNITLRDKVFDFELQTTKQNIQEVYQAIINKLQNDYTLSEEFKIKLLDYITDTYKKSEIASPDYREILLEKILFNATSTTLEDTTIPNHESDKTIPEIFEELNELVGLQNVKDMLNELVSLIQFKQKTEDSLKIKDTNLHMVFLGNPGTGKTTVARLVAGILYNLKYIKSNKLIEVSAKDLIGQYVGQTAPKTMEVIQRALGGVLFIDEAYSLASKPGSNNSFNEECIATLIQAMENYRDNLVVIFAGYSKEMDSFLKSNSGIVSRIGYTMEFKDYTVDELIKILDGMYKKAGFKVAKDVYPKVTEIINQYKDSEGFGNARFIRNVYEKSILKHASNTQETSNKKTLKLITADDITSDNIMKL